MSGRFVRASKFRHVYGQPAKREKYYDNIRLTKNAWDSNLLKSNPKFLSVNWDAAGGGAFAVIPLSEFGKLPEILPLCRGHTGPVLDTDWNPFDDNMVVSGSDDGTVGVYKIPSDYTTKLPEDPEDIKDVLPVKKLKGHSKKVGHVLFHPVAENVLASASGDLTVKIWDIENEQCLATLIHTDMVTSFAWNENGSKLATVSRDKQLRVWDVRENKILTEGKAHNGAKSQRVCWLGSADRLVTTGFDRSDRQYALWDASDIAKGPIGGFQLNGSSSGICMPFFDEGTKMLYLIGKGDGNIQYYEYTDDDQLFPLSEYQSNEPQRGVSVLPRRALNVHVHEIFRVFKSVNDNSIEPISFIVPRKAETFQDDVYPEARAGVPALTAEEWWSGKDSNPKVISLAAVFEGTEAKPFTGISKQPSRESIKKEESKKTEKKEVTKKEEPAKEEPKEEPKKETAPAVATTSEKKNLDEILSGDGVDKMLDKANSVKDAPPSSIEADSWGSDDDEPPKRDPEPSRSRATEVKEQIRKEPGSESEQDDISIKKEPVPQAQSSPETTHDTIDLTADEPEEASPVVEQEPQTIAALTDQIARLSATLNTVVTELKTRDDKIDKLEAKIDSLLKK